MVNDDLARRLAEYRSVFVAGPPITDGYRGVDVVTDGDDIQIRFRWWLDPNVYAVRVSEAVKDDFWDGDLILWMQENLDTGAVRWATRRRQGDVIVLDWTGQNRPGPRDWYTSPVPLDAPTTYGIRVRDRWLWSRRIVRPGNFLQRYGFHIDEPKRLLAQGRLVGWRVLWTNDLAPVALGQCAIISGAEPAHAIVSTLELSDRADDEGTVALISDLLHDAAEAGYRRVTSPLTSPRLVRAGLRAQDGQGVAVDLDDLDQPNW